jgi:quinolinate synthase
MPKNEILQEITSLKEERKAVILAHYYQLPDIQDIADYVGDSLALSKLAAELPNELIVFCGVDFMAESAKLLSPQKTVLLPVKDACCPMADMATPSDVMRLKAEHPDAAVVSYVNSTTQVKAVSDMCCTSGNALKVIRSLPQKKIIFLPDENLGSYAATQIPEKEFVLFKGFCPPHEEMMAVDVRIARTEHPDALLLVHPECRPEVRALADFIGSTAQILQYATESKHKQFIIGTEQGILHPLKQQLPGKEFYILGPGLFCPNMKKTTPDLLLQSLKFLIYPIDIEPALAKAARIPIKRMLDLS